MKTEIKLIWLISLAALTQCAIVPPPWADPTKNPCANQPRGWQLIYWPDDGKCYKIYQIGAPCPETMELTPPSEADEKPQCKCPPGTAQSPRDALCHPIFSRATCPTGQYFAPVPDDPNKPRPKQRWGICRDPEECDDKDHLFWPRDGKCYKKMSRGPCPKGELITPGEDGLAVCSCSPDMADNYWPNGSASGCFEHYTRGPCGDYGDLFLPGGTCGCHSNLAHYHSETKTCYPIGGAGPCRPGHLFVLPANQSGRAQCECKPGRALYQDGICYRLYTRGPCNLGEMLANSTSCIPVPCKRGRLYFPNEKTCYKIGSQGPCPVGQVVLYDYNTRPSIDGASYNGVCDCPGDLKSKNKCYEDTSKFGCDNIPGTVFIDKTCHKLYTQGPCAKGEWLVAQRAPRNGRNWHENDAKLKAKCACRPGYSKFPQSKDLEQTNFVTSEGCQPPAVSLARFLNAKFRSNF